MYTMSSRSRGRVSGRGFSRGGPPSRGGGREYYRGQGRPSSGPRGGQDPDRLLSALGPEAKLALTQALVASVLGPESRNGYGGGGGGGGSSSYRDGREGNYRNYREGRGGYKEDYHPREQQRRHFGDDRSRPYYQQPRYEGGRSYREEERWQGRPRYERDGKPPMGSMRPRTNYHKYVGPSKRRSSPHDHPGASNKRQRPEELDGRDKARREIENTNSSEKHAPNEDEEGKDLSGVGDGSSGKPSGVQVTIRADGERAVNSEGHVRSHVGGGMYVELRCPHCPNQRSITFKEYKYHLASDAHKGQLNSLARKHSLVLRKIRVQQRQEQKDIEAKFREEKPEEFKNAVTRFCNMCKLAFKNMPMEDNSLVHNRSKLHRIQRHYLHPRCLVCRITFRTRIVYEHHMASIKHLRALTAMLDKGDGGHEDGDKSKNDNEDEELDLRNFMTLDSVGEDDDEVGSEHEEITGGLDVAEIADEDLAGGEEEVEGAPRKHGDVGLAWEKLQLEDDEEEEEEDQQPLGTDYVSRIQAYFCSLCHKIIRGDSSHGARAVRKHCRGVTHISHYNELHPPEQSEGDVSGDEGEKAEDNKNGETEGETVAAVKEEGEGEDEEAEGEEEGEGDEAEVNAEDKAEVDKEAEQSKVEDDKETKEEEELDEEEDEGMAEEKEEGWDEEVGDDFTAP